MIIPAKDSSLCKGPVARGAWNTLGTTEGKSGRGEGSVTWASQISRILGLYLKSSGQTWQGFKQRRSEKLRHEL